MDIDVFGHALFSGVAAYLYTHHGIRCLQAEIVSAGAIAWLRWHGDFVTAQLWKYIAGTMKQLAPDEW